MGWGVKLPPLTECNERLSPNLWGKGMRTLQGDGITVPKMEESQRFSSQANKRIQHEAYNSRNRYCKNVMQVHYVDVETGEVVNKPLKRARLLEPLPTEGPV